MRLAEFTPPDERHKHLGYVTKTRYTGELLTVFLVATVVCGFVPTTNSMLEGEQRSVRAIKQGTLAEFERAFKSVQTETERTEHQTCATKFKTDGATARKIVHRLERSSALAS